MKKFPERYKCVYTIVTEDWMPDFSTLTLSLIRRWADRISSDFHIINSRKFEGYPINYEKFQIYELGKEYFWNIFIDADFIINPDKLEDPTSNRDPNYVYVECTTDLGMYYNTCPYFKGMSRALTDPFVVSSFYTHDIWEPLDIKYEDAVKYCKYPRMISEFTLTYNMVKNGYPYNGLVEDRSHLVHLLSTTDDRDENELIDKAKGIMDRMGVKTL